MKSLIYLLMACCVLIFAQACQDRQGKNYNKEVLADQNGVVFIKSGIEGGLTEIKASGLAITNSSNQRVIALAKQIIEDHTQANDDLKKIERDAQIVEVDTISPAHEQMIADLSKKSGKAFDRAYLQMMVADHQEAVKLFTTATQNSDADIKKLAVKTLPTVKMHLDTANAICIAVK